MEELILLIPLAAFALWVAAIISLACLQKVHCKSRCAACGYSRAGLSNLPVCPECGHGHGVEVDPIYRAVVANPQDRLWLVIGPIIVGLVGSIVGFALALGSLGIWAAPLSLIVGLVPIWPALFVGLLSSGRVSRRVTWALAILSALPGVALAVAAFASMAPDITGDPLALIGLIIVAAYGAMISLFVAGLFGCIAATVQRRRNARLRRNRSPGPQPRRAKPVQASTPDGADPASARTDQI